MTECRAFFLARKMSTGARNDEISQMYYMVIMGLICQMRKQFIHKLFARTFAQETWHS